MSFEYFFPKMNVMCIIMLVAGIGVNVNIRKGRKTKMLAYFHNPVINIYFVLQFNLDTHVVVFQVPISSSHSLKILILLDLWPLLANICKFSQMFCSLIVPPTQAVHFYRTDQSEASIQVTWPVLTNQRPACISSETWKQNYYCEARIKILGLFLHPKCHSLLVF